MKTTSKTILFSAIAVLTLASCSGNPPVKTISEEEMNGYVENLKLNIEGDVYGNIYLPEEVDGIPVTWESDKPEIINGKAEGSIKPGKVTRPEADTLVKLTANIEKENGEKGSYTQEIKVKGLTKHLTEDDYQGYLFGHFIGENKADEEQIYFALAEEGLRFTDMNNRQPVLKSEVGEKGVRDPYICRSPEGDRFFLIATDLSIYHRGGWKINAQGYYDPSTTGSHNLVLWQSFDLVNWGEPKLLPLAPENAGMAWAPEMIYNDVTGEYIVFFASSIMNQETKMKDKPNAIYYASTRDFVHFSETKIFIDNQTDPDGKAREIIDTTVLKVGDTYYSASKDGDNREQNGGIRIMKTKNLLDKDSWEKVLDLDELNLNLNGLRIRKLDNSTLEGPEFFVYNKKDRVNADVPEYGLMADQYSVGAGYLPLKTFDLEDKTNENNSWSVLQSGDYSFGSLTKRHGTILRITADEIQRIKDNF